MMNGKLSACALLCIFLCACRYDVKEFDLPSWDAELLGPLAKSELHLEDVSELDNLVFTTTLSASDLGLAYVSIPSPLPSVNVADVGPISIPLFEDFEHVEADSVFLIITIENNFSFGIKSGAKLSLVNQASNQNVYTHLFSEGIAPRGQTTEEVKLADRKIEEYVELILQDIKTEAVTDATITASDHLKITFEIIFLKINSALLKPNAQISVSDTTGFQLKGDNLNVISIEGKFNAFVTNGFPFSGNLQAYFFATQNVFLDSLFIPSTSIAMPALNASGEVIAPLETKLTIPMSAQRVESILDARKVFFQLKLNGPSTGAVVENSNSIAVQIVGDLRVQYQP